MESNHRKGDDRKCVMEAKGAGERDRKRVRVVKLSRPGLSVGVYHGPAARAFTGTQHSQINAEPWLTHTHTHTTTKIPQSSLCTTKPLSCHYALYNFAITACYGTTHIEETHFLT